MATLFLCFKQQTADERSISDWSSDVCSSDLDVADIGVRTIQYELGYPRVTETEVSLRHEDVLTLMTALLARTKFRAVMTARYPILLVDEDRKSTRLNSSH